MSSLESLLKVGDLRTIGNVDAVVNLVNNQRDFDLLFAELQNSDDRVVMKAADAVEKITRNQPDYLQKHKPAVLNLLRTARLIQLKWHLAAVIPRLKLTEDELGVVWKVLSDFAVDQNESRIVRTLSIQSLFDLLPGNEELTRDLIITINQIYPQNVPSINARIRQLCKKPPLQNRSDLVIG